MSDSADCDRGADASRELTSQGKLPHDVELEKHPEKSIEGKMWLMGDVSALIHVSAWKGERSQC